MGQVTSDSRRCPFQYARGAMINFLCAVSLIGKTNQSLENLFRPHLVRAGVPVGDGTAPAGTGGSGGKVRLSRLTRTLA
jgi:hypothetical protein